MEVKTCKEFIKELQSEEFEPLPDNAISGLDFDEWLRQESWKEKDSENNNKQ